MDGGGYGSGAKTIANAGQIIYFFHRRLKELIPDVSGGDQNDGACLQFAGAAGEDAAERDMAGSNFLNGLNLLQFLH